MNAQVSALHSEANQVLASEQHARDAFEQSNWGKYDGQRVTGSQPGTVFLVLNGELRGIPDPATYNNLFNDWNTIVVSDYLVDNIPAGPGLSVGAVLAKGNASDAVFLVSNGSKQWVPSPAVFERFAFNGNNVNVIAQVIVDAAAQGPNVG